MSDRRGIAAAGIAIATAAAYSNTLGVPFFFDDTPAISDNATLRHLGRIATVLSPSAVDGSGVSGRPIVNLSLALNYAVGGLAVQGYHLANLAIHILSALVLFGLARRTLASRPLAFGIAFLWALHPLLTESVTDVIQRTESLMGLFYLLTLYFFVRGTETEKSALSQSRDAGGGLELKSPSDLRASAPLGGASGLGEHSSPETSAPSFRRSLHLQPLVFFTLSVASCLLGMATKEVMVSAPLIVLLYDRTFLAGSFRQAWRRRRPYYLALAATWLLLAALVIQTKGDRGGSAGFGHGVTVWAYALTQCRAIVLYLRLALWPHPLAVDYGSAVVSGLSLVWPQALLILALLAATVWALARRPALGFCGAWFFAILAPSSSVIPLVTQTVAEHRMYLPLAAVVVLAAIAIERLAGRAALAVYLVLGVVLGAATFERNRDYRDEVSIWAQTLSVVPDNPRTQYNYGLALEHAGRPDEAAAHYREAIRLKPDYAEPHNNLGDLLFQRDRLDEAASEYAQAVRLEPRNAVMAYNLANTLVRLGRPADSLPWFERALALKADYAEACSNEGIALSELGRWPEAEARFNEAIRLEPGYPVAHFNLGNVYAQTDRMSLAISEFTKAISLDPGYARARANLGNALYAVGRVDEAIASYREALRLDPNNARVHSNLANALMTANRPDEARAESATAHRLDSRLGAP